MEQKKSPLSIRIILSLTNIGFGLLALTFLVNVVVNVILYTNKYKENIGISIPLPVEIDFLQTGKMEISDKTVEVKLVKGSTYLLVKNAPAAITKVIFGFTLLALVFSAYLLSIFRKFILNVKKGKTFSINNILLLKTLAYGLSFLWLIMQLYTIIVNYFVVSELEYDKIDFKYQLINYPGILILALFIWVIAHVFITGLKMQEEQDLTI